jgi:DNA polymerase-3 subunit epsilon
MPNSLDALCKRFKVSLVERTLHGALIDARLLAEVYLELRGGKERVLDLSAAPVAGRSAAGITQTAVYGARPQPLTLRSTPEEQAAHIAFLAQTLKDHSLWDAYGVKIAEDAA